MTTGVYIFVFLVVLIFLSAIALLLREWHKTERAEREGNKQRALWAQRLRAKVHFWKGAAHYLENDHEKAKDEFAQAQEWAPELGKPPNNETEEEE
jgi:flagellar biosynthesis/type III secretory pathway M-ring protein FliF/YscJ